MKNNLSPYDRQYWMQGSRVPLLKISRLGKFWGWGLHYRRLANCSIILWLRWRIAIRRSRTVVSAFDHGVQAGMALQRQKDQDEREARKARAIAAKSRRHGKK